MVKREEYISKSPLDGMDLDKMLSVLRSSIVPILLIFFTCLAIAILYVRYKKPVFESYSDLQLDVQKEASMLGLYNFGQENDLNELSREIELIRSKLFFSKIIDVLNLEVAIFKRGNINSEERYRNAPVNIRYERIASSFYNREINFEILDKDRIALTYFHDDEEKTITIPMDTWYRADGLNLHFSLTSHYVPQIKDQTFFFILHSDEQLQRYLDKNLNVEPLNFNANTIRISFRDHNRYKAKALVDAIDTLYLIYSREAKNKATQQRISFLDEQLEQTATMLENYEDYFENFTIENKTINLNEDLAETIERMNALDSQRFQLRERQEYLGQVLQEIREESKIITDPALNSLLPRDVLDNMENYNELLIRRKLLLESYNENTRAVGQLKNQLSITRSTLMESIDRMQANLSDDLEEINRKKQNLEQSFVTLPTKNTSFSKAQRFYALYEQFYLSLLQKKTEYQIDQAGTFTKFVILSPANLPTQPIGPNKYLIYGIGLVAGIVISFIFLGVKYVMHQRITSSRHLERYTDQPLLGQIPQIAQSKLQNSQLITNRYPKSAAAEAFRAIRTNTQFMLMGKEARVISVTSTVSGEGKTFASVNLGGVFATTGKKVLVLDLDMRLPKIHRAFGHTEQQVGLSTILIKQTNWKDAVRRTDAENLFYIPAGPIPPNPSELILSQAFSHLLDKLLKEFDLVIMDTPPIGLVTDGVIAMQKSDLHIYVVRSDYSKIHYLNTLNKTSREFDGKSFAVVLNAIKGSKRKGYGFENVYYQENGHASGTSLVDKVTSRL